MVFDGSARGAASMHFPATNFPKLGTGSKLIVTMASWLLCHLGQLADAEGMAERFKLTTRETRELSIIALALLLCTERSILFTPQAVATLHQKLGVGR
jgi:hypothetical protein